VKELQAYSKAKTPAIKIAKLTKLTVGSLRQKALTLGIRLGHRRSAHYDFSWVTALAAEQESSPEGL
jgi:hypothetical protein